MKKNDNKTVHQLRAEIEELRMRLREAEDTIRKSLVVSGEQLRYRQIVETMQEAALTTTPEGRILFCNQRFAALVQQPAELVVGRPLDEFAAPFDHRSVVALLVGAQVRPTRKRVVFQASDGSHVPASVAANILEQAGPPKICMVATDLTELEASEQTLEETETQRQALEESTTALRESRLAALNLMEEAVAARQEAERLNEELRRAKDDWENTFNTVPDLIAVLDSEFRIVRLNRAMAERLAKTVGECVGTKCHETLHGLPEPPNYCPHILTLKDGKEHTAEFYEPRLGADFFVSTTPMFDEQGKMSGVIHVARDITELKAAEQALRESEQRYRRLVETATEGIWQLDGDFNTVYVNGQMAEMLGCKPEDVVGRNVREFMAEDQAEDVELRVANRQQGVSETYERKLRRKDGASIWTFVSASPLRDSEGKIYGSFGLFTDITKRKKAEEALRASEARLRATLRSAVDEIWLVDTQGRILSISDSVTENLGASSDKWADVEAVLNQLEVFRPDGSRRPKDETILLRALRGEVITDEQEIIRNLSTGQLRWREVSAAPIRDEDRVIGAVAVARDITARKEAEKQLRETQESLESERNLLQTIIDAAGESHLVYLDRDFNFVLVNAAYAKTCGYEPHEMIGRNHFALYPHEENEAIFRRVRDTGEPVQFHDKPFTFPDQPERGVTYWDWTLIPVKSDSGRVEGLVFSLVETTERKKAEEERERLLAQLADKNKELQSIVYVASHDLRSPLLNVYGFSGQLAEQLDALEKILLEAGDIDEARRKAKEIIEKELPENLGFIRAGAQKMQMLINGLLTMSRIGTVPLRIETIDMNELFRHIADAVSYEAKEKGAKINVRDLPPCRGDASQINQLFSNIVSNALKYLDQERKGQIHVTGRREGEMNIYSVCDNGIGIAPEHKERIFEIFHRLNPKNGIAGEGLGLSIVLRIIDRHGGRIWVDSTPGKGSTFHVALPAG